MVIISFIFVINLFTYIITNFEIVKTLFETGKYDNIELGNYLTIFNILGLITAIILPLSLILFLIQNRYVKLVSIITKSVLLLIILAYVICAYTIVMPSNAILSLDDKTLLLTVSLKILKEIFFNLFFIVAIMLGYEIYSTIKSKINVTHINKINILEEKIKQLQEQLNSQNSTLGGNV